MVAEEGPIRMDGNRLQTIARALDLSDTSIAKARRILVEAATEEALLLEPQAVAAAALLMAAAITGEPRSEEDVARAARVGLAELRRHVEALSAKVTIDILL